MIHLTPQEVEEKYRQPDGSIHIPADVRIIMPNKENALSAIAKTKEKVKGMKTTQIDNVEIKDGKVFVDGVETDAPPGINV